ncbi:MAG: RHS repeat-associated core domain-containing protein [Pyrinomonadaceae bacterium]
MENPEINPATNRIKELQPDGDSVKDYEYDPAGNTTKDPDGRTFQYDGENKQIKVSNTAGTIGEYSFDGDGKRVKKHVPATGETTHFIYDAGGKLIAEYSTIVEPTATAKANYLTNDTLGSPRILTDRDGNVGSRRDFLPFGGEIPSGIVGRDFLQGYNVQDSIRQKFTSYERDNESDLNFAQARMFGAPVGRFTSPDPAMASASVDNPQTWNRYVYVLNNPVKYSDPLGLWEIDSNYETITETNDKGKKKVTKVRVILKKEDGDDAKTLAKQLKISEKAAQKLLNKADSNGNIRLSEAGGSIGNVFKNIEKILVAYEQFKIDNPDQGDNNGQSCSSTASFLATGGRNTQNGVGALDQYLGQMGVDMNGNPTGMRANARSINENDLQIGDIVRYALNNTSMATHFTTFLMLNRNGEPVVFSKNGDTGTYSFAEASAYEGREYGTITPLPRLPNGGASGDKTGFYRPLN